MVKEWAARNGKGMGWRMAGKQHGGVERVSYHDKHTTGKVGENGNYCWEVDDRGFAV